MHVAQRLTKTDSNSNKIAIKINRVWILCLTTFWDLLQNGKIVIFFDHNFNLLYSILIEKSIIYSVSIIFYPYLFHDAACKILYLAPTHQTLALATLVLWVRKGHSIIIGVALVGTAVTPPTSTGVRVGGGTGDTRTLKFHTVHWSKLQRRGMKCTYISSHLQLMFSLILSKNYM